MRDIHAAGRRARYVCARAHATGMSIAACPPALVDTVNLLNCLLDVFIRQRVPCVYLCVFLLVLLQLDLVDALVSCCLCILISSFQTASETR